MGRGSGEFGFVYLASCMDWRGASIRPSGGRLAARWRSSRPVSAGRWPAGEPGRLPGTNPPPTQHLPDLHLLGGGSAVGGGRAVWVAGASTGAILLFRARSAWLAVGAGCVLQLHGRCLIVERDRPLDRHLLVADAATAAPTVFVENHRRRRSSADAAPPGPAPGPAARSRSRFATTTRRISTRRRPRPRRGAAAPARVMASSLLARGQPGRSQRRVECSRDGREHFHQPVVVERLGPHGATGPAPGSPPARSRR